MQISTFPIFFLNRSFRGTYSQTKKKVKIMYHANADADALTLRVYFKKREKKRKSAQRGVSGENRNQPSLDSDLSILFASFFIVSNRKI